MDLTDPEAARVRRWGSASHRRDTQSAGPPHRYRHTELPDGVYQLEPPLFVAGDDFNAVLVAPPGCWLGRISANYLTGASRWMFALDAEGLEQEAPAGWEGHVGERMDTEMLDLARRSGETIE